jgi:hypothetical protein
MLSCRSVWFPSVLRCSYAHDFFDSFGSNAKSVRLEASLAVVSLEIRVTRAASDELALMLITITAEEDYVPELPPAQIDFEDDFVGPPARLRWSPHPASTLGPVPAVATRLAR